MIKSNKINTFFEKIVLNTLKAIFSDWTSRIIGILISFILIRDFHIDRNYQSILIILTTFIVVNIIDFSIRTPVFLYTKKHFTKKVDGNTQLYLLQNFNCVLNFDDINYNEYLKSIHLVGLSKNFFRVQLNDHKVIMIPYYFEEMSISERIDMSFLLFYSFRQVKYVREIPDSIKKYIFLKIVLVEKIK